MKLHRSAPIAAFGTILFWGLLNLIGGVASAQQYVFQKIGLEQGIPSARVNDMLQDQRGLYWLATEGAGLVLYDGFNFRQVQPDRSDWRPVIDHIEEDSSGNLWLSSENNLIRYDGHNFRQFSLPAGAGRIRAIALQPEGRHRVATSQKVYELRKDSLYLLAGSTTGLILDYCFYAGHWYQAGAEGLFADGELLQAGLCRQLLLNDGVLYAATAGAVVKIEKDTVPSVVLNRAGVFLTSYQGSFAALSGDSLFIPYKGAMTVLSAGNGLPDLAYNGLYLDDSDMLWLYSDEGLVKFQGLGVRKYGAKSGLGEVVSVLRAQDELWLGTSRGLARIDGDGRLSQFPESAAFGVILAIAEYKGAIWLGTESGLLRYDGRRFRKMRLSAEGNDFIFSLYANQEGLWIGTGSGIVRYHQGAFLDITTAENLPVSTIYGISEAPDGSLWFGTYTSGFIVKEKQKWSLRKAMGGVAFDSLRFSSFKAMGSNELWAGSLNDGLYHFTRDKVHHLSPDRLDFAEILAMDFAEDRLWLGTNKGLYHLQKSGDDYSIRRDQSTQLLESGSFSISALHAAGGQLLAGTQNGLLLIELEEELRSRPDPRLIITDVELFFGEVSGLEEYAEGTTAFTNLPQSLILPHDLNFLSFTLAGLSGYQPEELIYRYRIKGNGEWTEAGSRREAVFANLDPGSYRFEAQVSRTGDDWSNTQVSYPFQINAPLWQRWYFVVSIVVVAGAIIYLYLHERISRSNQRLKLENSLMEMERKALRLQMNPHFIFNALDSISSFIFRNDPKQAVRYLNNFAKLMRLTLESSMEHLHPVETEVGILKNYLELEKLRFRDKFDYQIELDDEIDYNVGIPPMLIQPHVENAILHGIKPKKEKAHLTIRFILEEEMLICEVEDDGIGRAASRQLAKRKDHRSMATRINKDRLKLLAKAMNENVDIKIIDLPRAGGTKVIIRLPAKSI